jgi:transcriptional regulator with PAS, ATPase and Fis domain
MTATLQLDQARPAIVAASANMRQAMATAERFARSSIPVLLVGATGTGKEVLAQYVQRLSGRPGELVDINCAALPREMMESLLFGHVRGAFTGASSDAIGLIARANRGTLFLDELSSMPVDCQAKLLRVLETREVRRVGDDKKSPVDFRLIAAVQEDLAERMESARFRRDLYYRISGVTIELATLEQRRDDIVPLAQAFAGAHGCTLEPGAGTVLAARAWPGNVRELRSVIDRAAVIAEDAVLSVEVLAAAMVEHPRSFGRPAERISGPHDSATRLVRVCVEHGWDRQAIARDLGISVATLYRRLKAAGISRRLSGAAT